MRNRVVFSGTLAVALCILAGASPASASGSAPFDRRPGRGRIPLAFEENQGQTDSAVRFLARVPGHRLFLTDDSAWVSAGSSPAETDGFRISLVGADPNAEVIGEGRQARVTNYLIGSDPRLWRRNVPSFSRVRYRDVHPGVDLVYYGGPDLEFDIEVRPGADPRSLRLSVGDADSVTVEPGGEVCVSTGLEDHRFLPPSVYQEIGGRRRPVSAGYVLSGGDDPTVGFRIGEYDERFPLIIDPVLLYSTYLGGTDDDEVDAIAVDPEGNAYVTGRAYSTDFPVSGDPVQAADGGNEDTYVTKIDASGTAIVYSTYLGVIDRDFGNAIAVDDRGQAVAAGRTISPNFPGASSSPIQNTRKGDDDGFVIKLDASGSNILFSTYLGGKQTDKVTALALDSDGNILVAGETSSLDFPGAAGSPFGPVYRGNDDAFVAKIDSGGFSILYAAYLGGSESDSASAIAVDRQGNAYVAGGTYSPFFTGTGNSPIQKTRKGPNDGFLTKIDAGGTRIVYSTLLGGGEYDFVDGVVVDARGQAIVAGYTTSTNFPGAAGGFQGTNHGKSDGFLTQIDSAGSAILYSTYLGGSQDDYVDAIALDSLGGVYVVGYTESPNFPGAASSSIQPAYAGAGDGFEAQWTRGARTLVRSTYLGGGGYDEAWAVAVHSRSAYVAGVTDSQNFPGASTSPIQGHLRGASDGFIARISADDLPPRSFVVPVDPPSPALVDR